MEGFFCLLKALLCWKLIEGIKKIKSPHNSRRETDDTKIHLARDSFLKNTKKSSAKLT